MSPSLSGMSTRSPPVATNHSFSFPSDALNPVIARVTPSLFSNGPDMADRQHHYSGQLQVSRSRQEAFHNDFVVHPEARVRTESRDTPSPFNSYPDVQSSSFPIEHENILFENDYNYNAKMDPEDLSHEQQNMQEQLYICFQQKNIQLTVSTLRKIYTKQCRIFRIPLILTAVMPSSSPDIQSQSASQQLQSNVIFTLNCIQWSIGAQKNSNSESFKYKMNKKISHWLLKEQIKKGMPVYYNADIGNVAVSVVQSILKQVMELELSLELLEAIKFPKPFEVLLPFIYSWCSSGDPLLSSRAREFAIQHNISTHSPGPSTHSVRSDVMGQMSSSGMMMMNSSQHVGDRGVTSQSSDIHDAELHHRLFLMLKSHPEGILGSRIPTVYKDNFREPLRLRGQKLKDIMTGVGAEMIGDDGPGDKVFFLKSRGASLY